MSTKRKLESEEEEDAGSEEEKAPSGEDNEQEGSDGDEESESEVDEAELRAKYGPGLVVTREKRATAGKRLEFQHRYLFPVLCY